MVTNDRLEAWVTPPDPVPNHWFQTRGRAFERILRDILLREGLSPRTNFRPSGEEVDGSFLLGERVFLLEAKWRKDPIPASDLYSFKGKVDGKLIGTVGVFVSMSGYSPEAIDALKFGKEINLILFSADDVLRIDGSTITFSAAMREKLRYAAEEGQPYYPLAAEDPLRSTEMTDIVVEGSFEEEALRIVFSRLGLAGQVRLWPAGGQSAAHSLVRRLRSGGHSNVWVIVDADIPDELRLALRTELGPTSDQLVVMSSDTETWLEGATPDEYLLALPATSVRLKTARRLGNNVNLDTLLAANRNFAALVRSLRP